MQRNTYIEKLLAWKRSARRKPLILEGARQVGKTWLMREFAKTNYKSAVYARFDKDARLQSIFSRDFDVNRIVRELEILFHARIDPSDTILLFDEIQSCRNALTSLKYFCEDRPDLHVIAAGSLLGLEYRDDEESDGDGGDRATGFPVGKVNTIPVRPLSFTECLDAAGENRLSDAIRNAEWDLLRDFGDVLAEKLRYYFVIGGMPEAVATFLESGRLLEVGAVHREILSGYRRDISKHAPKSDVVKIGMCWDSIPVQLARENKKFTYSALRRGGRASEFRDPLAWLEDAGLVHLCRRVSTPALPLDAYSNGGFKAFSLDVGLLSTMSGLAPETVLDGSRLFREFKGALTEQYVHQQLLAESGLEPCYWSTEDSRTEIDFVFAHGGEVIPLEVKSGGNVRSQSLKSYIAKFRPEIAFRASLLPFAEQTVPVEGRTPCRLFNVPPWAVGQCQKLTRALPPVEGAN